MSIPGAGRGTVPRRARKTCVAIEDSCLRLWENRLNLLLMPYLSLSFPGSNWNRSPGLC